MPVRETSSEIFAEIPTLRKAILFSALLALCAYPWTTGKGLLVVLGLGLGAVKLLADWQPGHGPWLPVGLGWTLFLAAAAIALLLPRRPSLGTPPSLASP